MLGLVRLGYNQRPLGNEPGFWQPVLTPGRHVGVIPGVTSGGPALLASLSSGPVMPHYVNPELTPTNSAARVGDS